MAVVVLRDGRVGQQNDYSLAVLVFAKGQPGHTVSAVCRLFRCGRAGILRKETRRHQRPTDMGKFRLFCTGEPPLTALADHMPMRAPDWGRYAGTGICVLLNITRTRQARTRGFVMLH